MVCEDPLQLKLSHDPNAGSEMGFFPQKRASTNPQALLSSIPQLLAWQKVNRHQSSDSESLHGETALGYVDSQRGLIMCEETGKAGRGFTLPK